MEDGEYRIIGQHHPILWMSKGVPLFIRANSTERNNGQEPNVYAAALQCLWR